MDARKSAWVFVASSLDRASSPPPLPLHSRRRRRPRARARVRPSSLPLPWSPSPPPRAPSRRPSARARRARPSPEPAAPRGAAVAPAPNAPRRRVVARGSELSWDEADAELLSLECVPRAPRSAARPAPPERAPFAARRNPRGSAAVASPSIRFGRRAFLFLADLRAVSAVRRTDVLRSFPDDDVRAVVLFLPLSPKIPSLRLPSPLLPSRTLPPRLQPRRQHASLEVSSPARTRRRFACARPTAGLARRHRGADVSPLHHQIRLRVHHRRERRRSRG